jgi:hypothetical protein
MHGLASKGIPKLVALQLVTLVILRPWKDHFKSDLRSDQDHLLKKDLSSDQDHIFKKNDLDLKSRSKIIFCPKCPLFEGQNFKTDKKSFEIT